MDFVDLDRVLDEFEEEEKQALTIVPGHELKPSGYIEFLEKHQENDWQQINSGGPFSSTGGYTLERNVQKDPVSVSYDEPYDSLSSKLNPIAADDVTDKTSYKGLERSPDTTKLSYQSEIVTSLTRVSSNGDHIGTVYNSLNGYDRKGIANRSERKGTIACQAMEVQTDALSPASEEELMSSPFPKTDIIVDGHGDTSVSNSDVGDQNHSPPIYASMDNETILSASGPGPQNMPRSQGFVGETECQSNMPNLAQKIPKERKDHSSLASNFGVSEHIVSGNNVVGFDNSTGDDLNEDEINMYLEEFEAVKENSEFSSLDFQLNKNIPDFQGVQTLTRNSMEQSLADELQEAQPKTVDSISTSEQSESLPKKFCPDPSPFLCVNQEPGPGTDLTVASTTPEANGSCISRSDVEATGDVLNSVLEVNVENTVHDEGHGQLQIVRHGADNTAVFDTVMGGKMEIESILDDKKSQQSLNRRNNVSGKLLQGKMEIEDILDDAISYQQSNTRHDVHQRDMNAMPSDMAEQLNFIPRISNGCDKSCEPRSTEQCTHSLSPASSTEHKEPGSPMLGVGARPKDPSAIKKNRPNSLLGLSKVNLDFSAVPKEVTDIDSTNGQSNTQSPSKYPNGASQFYQPPESLKKSQTLSVEPQVVADTKQRLNPDPDLPESEQKPTPPVIHDFTQVNNEEEVPAYNTDNPEDPYASSPPESLDSDPQSGGSRKKRPTSLDLPHRPGFEVGSPEEEANQMNDQSSISSNGIHPEQEEEGAVGQTLTQAYSPDYSAFEMSGLGYEAPVWIPDSDAPVCMMCQARFTMWKRRHHCRACGKVLCSTCCSQKALLPFLDNKEARVCVECNMQLAQELRAGPDSNSPNPNNPTEYCSKVPPSQQASGNANPPVVMVPTGVLKTSGSQRKPGEQKQVIFSDGIRPGGDLTELDGPDQSRRRRSARASRKSASHSAQQSRTEPVVPKTKEECILRTPCLVPESGLPPLYIITGESGVIETDEVLNQIDYTSDYKSEDGPLISYAVNRNLSVGIKIIYMDCCVNRWCWCFVTRGMNTAGQAELVVLLELTPEEIGKESGLVPPNDMFWHFHTLYADALKGNFIYDMGHTIFNQTFLGSRDHGGFLYVQPTFQCMTKLPLPECPYLFGVLLQKWEVPWAKVFPIRLMLRLGAEFRYYPCPLVSVRNRKPVFLEIGHTIINLLADFRNYQYMLTQIKGATIHMENKKTVISFPRNRYNDVMKVVRNSNEHVMALGSSFSTEADSHLVCIQSEDGNYQTQAINIQNKPRLVTGASFVVFNGALKSSSGLRAKSSIVEDGLMIQVLAETLASLKQALVDMAGFTIQCGPADEDVPEESVEIRWVDNDKGFNLGVKSYLDYASLEGVESVSVKCPMDILGIGDGNEGLAIRWSRVYFLPSKESSTSNFDPMDLSRLTEDVAQATCLALAKHLGQLKGEAQTRLGLRVNLTRDAVGYEMGSKGKPLPPAMVSDLDTFLVPIVHQASEEGIIMELVFNIVD
ncbi:hypothetical protein EGW08_019160 [Elysia chlorotica]|uniref:FYVE-type domain-containing protein n=1 Tax=Elysia chlorotica TaxID=188477 RepID=A0A433SV18_ELYCH|nr:hypothetical protein EGW08_019160 [Elysia chlorotica]